MTDYTELKRLATRIVEVQTSQDVPISKLFDDFDAATSPEVVLALIAENESLRGSCKAMGADMGKLTRERNSFRSQAEKARAEVAGLRTGYEAYEQVNAELKAECDALRKDAERYEWICANACDLNFYAVGPAPIRGRVEIDAEQYPVSEWGSAKTELDSIIDAALGQGEQS